MLRKAECKNVYQGWTEALRGNVLVNAGSTAMKTFSELIASKIKAEVVSPFF